MFRRLFSSSHEFDKIFQDAKVDSTHNFVHPKKIVDLAARCLAIQTRQNIHININIQHTTSSQINININDGTKDVEKKSRKDKKSNFTQYFIKKMENKNMIFKIKMLVVAHAILRRVQNEDFNEALLIQLESMMMEHWNPQQKQQKRERDKVQIKVENTKEDFMQRNIISFYCFYLQKLMNNIDTYQFAKTYNPTKYQANNAIQIINRGFLVLNLVNYILKSQYTFNKMGRYYLAHKELLALFMKYLEDLIIYNSFIKKTSSLALNSIKEADQEEVKHFFLFVTEAQKTSDRLYEFFYNRYYYSEVKNMIMMPTFLTIHADQYKEIVDEVKKKDKELVVLVKRSKYESGNGRSYSCASKTSRTQEDEKQFIKTEGNSFSIGSLGFGIQLSQMQQKQKNGGIKVERKRCKTSYKR